MAAYEIDSEDVVEEFNRLADAFMAPLDGVLQACYPIVIQSIRDNFTSSVTPEGHDWPPRKIDGDGHPLEIESGKMLQAATGGGPGHVHELERYEGGTDLVVGVALDVVPYARAQALGYPPRNLPPRNYLGLDARGQDKVEALFAQRAEAVFTGQPPRS